MSATAPARGGAGPARVRGLDGLRMLAALAVFVCHLCAYWPTITGELRFPYKQLGDLLAHGVDVFVVLSGFSLAYPFMGGATTATTAFLKRRAIRLLPPYYVALLLAAALAMGPYFHLTVSDRATVGDLAWHLGLVQTFNPAVIGTINGSLWSVALEAQLYLVCPALIALALRGRIARVIGIAAVTSVSGGLIVLSTEDAFLDGLLDAHGIIVRLIQFTVGVGCAVLVQRRVMPPPWALWALLALGLLVGGAAASADQVAWMPLAWSIPSAALVLLCTGPLGGLIARTPLERLGRVSYSFYLIHQPILLLTGHAAAALTLGFVTSWVVALTLGLGLVFAVAAVLYLVVERPAHRYGRRRYPLSRPLDASVETTAINSPTT